MVLITGNRAHQQRKISIEVRVEALLKLYRIIIEVCKAKGNTNKAAEL